MRFRVLLFSVLAVASTTVGLAPLQAAVEVDDLGARDTVFVLAAPAPLAEVADAIARTGARPFSLEHLEPERGGFHSRVLDLAQTVETYRGLFALRHSGAVPEVFAFRLEGVVATHELGDLSSAVARRTTVGSPTTTSVSPAGGGTVETVDQQRVLSASVDPSPRAWMPERGKIDAYNNSGYCFWGTITCAEARGADLYLQFTRDTPGDEFNTDWAYEHDFKQVNENNWNTDSNPMCPPNQTNDFWADRYSGILWESSIPDPYLDTTASDSCREHDLTIGTLHPREFQQQQYHINLTVAPGDHGDSEAQLELQVLEKSCDSGNFAEWCAGLTGYKDKPVVVPSTQYQVPGCIQWTSKPIARSSC